MAHHIPTMSTDELLDRIASATASGWRHQPPARELPRPAERRPRFERLGATDLERPMYGADATGWRPVGRGGASPILPPDVKPPRNALRTRATEAADHVSPLSPEVLDAPPLPRRAPRVRR